MGFLPELLPESLINNLMQVIQTKRAYEEAQKSLKGCHVFFPHFN